jgi:beta-D-xylosidase 4
MPLLMAASFDDELIEKMGNVVGIEGRAFGNAGWSGMDYWTPNVNPFKDPRWGRGSETPGEDVLRVKRYAAFIIRGLEGPGPERRIVATCKHYAGNDFEDWNGATRHNFNAKITPQDLAEYYLAPFQQCARDSRVGSIMCAYNAVNGVPSCANSYLLQTILREHWNWTEHENYVTSDCEAVLDVWANHHYAKSNAEGTAMCFDAGTDTSCEYEGSSDIPGAWNQGLLKVSTIDRALRRLYQGLVRVGYFDGADSKYASLGWADVNKPESQRLALQAAVDGMVLLKNDGTLPLDKKRTPKVAMVGFWADAPDKLSGGYSGTAAFQHSPAFAARQMGWQVKTANGPVLQSTSANDTWTAPALSAAQDADYILYFGGLDTSAAGETKDRQSIDWPGAQLALINKLTQLNKPLVVIQLGDQLDDTPLLTLPAVNAILWANWPGQDGGPAVLQLLSGAKAPAGRLPVTMYPANYTTAIPMTDMNLRPSASSPGRTYRWYSTPVKPFGFGLHYTTFSGKLSNPFLGALTTAIPKIEISSLLKNCRNEYRDTCPLPSIPLRVTNTGKSHKSDYVALAFLSGEFGPKPYPIKTLVSYTRVKDIEPGKEKQGRLEWNLGSLARVDGEGNTVLYPGRYKVALDVDGDSKAEESEGEGRGKGKGKGKGKGDGGDERREGFEFELVGERVVLDQWPAPPA